MQGRTVTASLEFETRQHEIFGIDLGEGVSRLLLVMGGGLFSLWFAFLYLLFGPPTQMTVMLYVTIPAVVIFYAFQDDPKRARRKRIAGWANRIRYAIRGHRPFVAGALSRAHFDLLPASYRYGIAQLRARIKGDGEGGVWDMTSNAAPHPFTAEKPYSIRISSRIERK